MPDTTNFTHLNNFQLLGLKSPACAKHTCHIFRLNSTSATNEVDLKVAQTAVTSTRPGFYQLISIPLSVICWLQKVMDSK